MKKKLFSWLIITVMVITCVACGTNNTSSTETNPNQIQTNEETESVISTDKEEEITNKAEDNSNKGEQTYSMGKTVATNIMEFTLVEAEPAIALEDNDSNMYTFLTPKEYDATRDRSNKYVASIGHTLIYFVLEVKNLDRNSRSLNLSNIVTVIYKGKSYRNSALIGAKSDDEIVWELVDKTSVNVSPAESIFVKCYIDIPVEINGLSDDFDMVFALNDSNNNTQSFTYRITKEDLENQANREISQKAAIYTFKTSEAQQYFKNHMDRFNIVSGEEMYEYLNGKGRWADGNDGWDGYFTFEENGNVRERKKMSKDYEDLGYLANRKWSIVGDSVILSYNTEKSGYNEAICEARRVNEKCYLLVLDGKPYVIIHNGQYY